MESEHIKAWITKYALTGGIKCVDGKVCHEISGDMLSYERYGTAHGKDWHRTPEAALARAEEMRVAKLASMRKNIAKLEKMVFKVRE
jgi:hypothetical protein